MKKFLILLSAVFFISCQHSTWIEDKMKTYNVHEYVIKWSYIDDHQSFIEVYITAEAKARMFKNFKFSENLDSLIKGKYCPFISKDSNHIYSTVKGYGPYNYTLLLLAKEGNILILYDVFES